MEALSSPSALYRRYAREGLQREPEIEEEEKSAEGLQSSFVEKRSSLLEGSELHDTLR